MNSLEFLQINKRDNMKRHLISDSKLHVKITEIHFLCSVANTKINPFVFQAILNEDWVLMGNLFWMKQILLSPQWQ